MAYRKRLFESAKTAPELHLVIASSATLQKDEEIIINPLGLLSHNSMRTQSQPSDPSKLLKKGLKKNESDYNASGDDMRDGFVYFGCKKSVKLANQSNLDNESTTIVSHHV